MSGPSAFANESHDHSSSAGGDGVTVNTRTDTQTTTGDFVAAYAKCAADEVPVNGYWLVDGQEPTRNSGVSYSVGDTGEQRDGYRVHAGKSIFSLDELPDSTPVKITAVARCLVVD